MPNPLQRTLKPYVDWDMKLSTVEQSQFFESFTESDWLASKMGQTQEESNGPNSVKMIGSQAHKGNDPTVPWRVNFVRQLALRLPAVVCAMLRHMGCIKGTESVYVIVKVSVRVCMYVGCIKDAEGRVRDRQGQRACVCM